MSNSGSSSSSAPPIAPTPSSSSGPPRQVPPPPSSGQKQGPPLAIQTLVPQVVSVTAPLHPILDTPEIRCFAWRTQTPRSRASNLESALSSVCWHRTKHHIPSHIQAEATAERLRPGSANPRTNAMIAAHVEKKEAARAAEAEAESKEPIPKELPFLKGKLINYNVDQGVVPAGTRRTPMELQLETYPNGHFKDMTLRGGEIKRTSLGYEYYDSAGGYHYIVPLGVLHRRIYSLFADGLDRLYGPAFRAINRYTSSFESGHQQRMWAKLVENARNGEGLKLGKKMWETLKNGPGKGGKNDDDPGDGESR